MKKRNIANYVNANINALTDDVPSLIADLWSLNALLINANAFPSNAYVSSTSSLNGSNLTSTFHAYEYARTPLNTSNTYYSSKQYSVTFINRSW